MSKWDHTDEDCILIAILSHGEMGYIYARDCQYKLDNIWGYFTATQCPTLAGKPKLFFIQACQGDQLDAGVTLINRTETDSGDYSMSYKIPIHADFLIAYSTIPGTVLNVFIFVDDMTKSKLRYLSNTFVNLVLFIKTF